MIKKISTVFVPHLKKCLKDPLFKSHFRSQINEAMVFVATLVDSGLCGGFNPNIHGDRVSTKGFSLLFAGNRGNEEFVQKFNDATRIMYRIFVEKNTIIAEVTLFSGHDALCKLTVAFGRFDSPGIVSFTTFHKNRKNSDVILL